MPNPTEASTNVAASVRQLRELRGWTQQRLATVSGVPRPTLAGLEAGGENPTLSVMVRVATALGVGLDELTAPPRRSGRLYTASDLPSVKKNGVHIRALIPDAIPGVHVERTEFPANTSYGGTPHSPGTREFLACERGSITLTAAGERWELGPGDVVSFRGDQRHGYAAGDDGAVGYSVILAV